ncbi:MAG: transposase [Deltaproteobacteria bacterium]|nr:transposase [Deltaproteobacteria bacterium]
MLNRGWHTGARFSVNMISSITAREHLRFTTLAGRITAERFVEFLKRLLGNQAPPIFPIVDSYPIHKTGRVGTS